MILNAVLRFDDGAEISPGSFVLELRYVLCEQKQLGQIKAFHILHKQVGHGEVNSP